MECFLGKELLCYANKIVVETKGHSIVVSFCLAANSERFSMLQKFDLKSHIIAYFMLIVFLMKL